MSSLVQGAIIGVLALALFATGMPIAFALALTALLAVLMFLGPSQFDLFGKMLFDSVNDFGLLAIPLFVLMGNLFGGSAASKKLFIAGEAWLSRVRGGLAMSSIVASTVFAALTGSSPATSAAIGKIAVPEMAARGEGEQKLVSEESAANRTFSWRERFAALIHVVPFVALVTAILVVLYRGVATPSEVAAIGVLLVAVLVIVIYRGVTGRQLVDSLLESTRQSTMILMIVAFSAVIATVLSYLRVPQDLAALVTQADLNKWLVLLFINLILLLMGFFLPPVSIIVMTTSILLPIILALGFDPIWFGVVMTVNMEMGLITPPVGLNLYVLKGIAPQVPLNEILIGALPYVVVLGLAIVLFAAFPDIVLWLPQLLF